MVSNEEKMLKERIRNLLSIKKTNISNIANNASERVMFGRQINGENTSVPFKTLYRLLYMYQDIDANWLIVGEGSMYKIDHIAPHVYTQHNEVKGNTAGGDINVGPDSIITKGTVDALKVRIAEMQSRIAELEHDKALLSGIVENFINRK